jgi:Transposase zinc-binding domain
VQAIGRQPRRAPDGGPVHYERHRPEQSTLYRLVQQHAATFFAEVEAAAGADLPQFVKDEFDAFLECGILAHGLLRLRCGDCGHDKRVAFSRRARRRGLPLVCRLWPKRPDRGPTCRCSHGPAPGPRGRLRPALPGARSSGRIARVNPQKAPLTGLWHGLHPGDQRANVGPSAQVHSVECHAQPNRDHEEGRLNLLSSQRQRASQDNLAGEVACLIQHVVYSRPVHREQQRVRFLRGLTRGAVLRLSFRLACKPLQLLLAFGRS